MANDLVDQLADEGTELEYDDFEEATGVDVSAVIPEFPELHEQILEAMQGNLHDYELNVLAQIESDVCDILERRLSSEDNGLAAMIRKALLENHDDGESSGTTTS